MILKLHATAAGTVGATAIKISCPIRITFMQN
jgi:hypothetical protein